jgi:hypothetical protein
VAEQQGVGEGEGEFLTVAEIATTLKLSPEMVSNRIR